MADIGQKYLSEEFERNRLNQDKRNFELSEDSSVERIMGKVEDEYKGSDVIHLTDEKSRPTGGELIFNSEYGFKLDITSNEVSCVPYISSENNICDEIKNFLKDELKT